MTDGRCVTGVALLADYLDGLLPASEVASLEQHVLDCERCQAFIASYRTTPDILRGATDVVLPDDLRQKLAGWMKTWLSGRP